MTCADCRFYLPYPHEYDGRNYEGICRYFPRVEHKNKTMWCGQWKTTSPRRQTKNSIEYSAEFKEFYEAYPKKTAPNDAWRAWSNKEKLPPEHYGLAIKQAKAYSSMIQAEDKDMKYVKHPATWLNGGCWKDTIVIKSDARACEDCAAPYEDHWKYYKKVNKKKYYRCDSCKANTKH